MYLLTKYYVIPSFHVQLFFNLEATNC